MEPPVGCAGCHPDVTLDVNHRLECTRCHNGIDVNQDKKVSHQGLIRSPAHPDNMSSTCGACHRKQCDLAADSLHFTLKNKINQVRTHFGATGNLDNLTKVPRPDQITSLLELSDDMLRRRCLKCHLYASGDSYAFVHHGTGCAACHMRFEDSRLQAHSFQKPDQRQCQSCHYGNYVGSDFTGRFENDFNREYRTPYVTTEHYDRPYGVEQLNLRSDIHQQKGLTCTDCHGPVGHNEKTAITCITCHAIRQQEEVPSYLAINEEQGEYILKAERSGKKHRIPQLLHPAHQQYGEKVACQVCHAQWSFNDSTTHLLLTESEDIDQWERLTVQGSSDIEKLLEHNLYSDDEVLPLVMPDGITGFSQKGVWLKGFSQRRWEDILIRADNDGIIKIFRPILSLSLSMISGEDEVIFDNMKGAGNGLMPYTPHTTGAAGLFYKTRFSHLLPPESVSQDGETKAANHNER